MTLNVLEKESEFRKMNEELELQTKALYEKVNSVMKIQNSIVMEPCIMPKMVLNSFSVHDSDLNVADEENRRTDQKVDSSVKNEKSGINVVNQLLRTKMQNMSANYEKLFNEYKIKNEEAKKLQKENQAIAKEKTKWFSIANTSKNLNTKLENQVSSLSSKLQARESETTALKQQYEQAKKDLKNTTLNLNTAEVRLNRALEDIDKIKETLRSAKQEEKDSKENCRKQVNELTAILKIIENHKINLLDGFKKQSQLIDNLIRQKVCRNINSCAEMANSNFTKLLDQTLEELM